ncbi:MAG: hypothetical protein U0M60_20755, partial [Clostridia bacterium]|nr:hypothetical protein [Clostridia bacterium]
MRKQSLFFNLFISTSSTASGPPVSPVGSVGDKRLPPASIAPQGEGFSISTIFDNLTIKNV